ncbi:MAG: AAA domain-containing protein [Oligoflexia bacterium]|nr:AAA domain-containing protein [Oligoflexia bacterium]
MSNKLDQAREKSIRLFTYLRELTQLRSKVTTDIEDYEQVIWFNQVPKENGCRCIAWDQASEENSEIWIEINKPKRKPPPNLPSILDGWISKATLSESSRTPKLVESKLEVLAGPKNDGTDDETKVTQLSDRPEVSNEWASYLEKLWKPWAADDLKQKKIEDTYKEIFSIYQKQQRLGESYEVVVGIGFLVVKNSSSSSIRRHLLTTKASITFDSKRGVITLGPTAEGTKLQLEQEMLDPQDRPEPSELKVIEEQAERIGEELWDRVQVNGLLKSWIHSFKLGDGAYDETLIPNFEAADKPNLAFAPALILRKQTERSLLRLYQEIIEQLKVSREIPVGVRRLVDIIDDSSVNTIAGQERETPPNFPDKPQEIYFPLASNNEQRAIAESIESKQGILVQGPPGTGKSHTIANLVCHLLATGNRILVTSHTPRALKVLKDKFPKNISALCVSVLGEDAAGRKELEDSVQGIDDKFNSWNANENRAEIKILEERLYKVRREVASLKQQARSIREKEVYSHPVLFDKFKGTLASIARTVKDLESEFSWFEDRPSVEVEPPLNEKEFSNLVATLSKISPTQEAELRNFQIELSRLLEPEVFLKICEDEYSLKGEKSEDESTDIDIRKLFVNLPKDRLSDLRDQTREIIRVFESILEAPFPWLEVCLEQIFVGRDKAWKERLSSTKEHVEMIRSKGKDLLEAQAHFPEHISFAEARHLCNELLRHFSSGGGLGFGPFKAAPVKAAAVIIERARFNGKQVTEITPLRSYSEWLEVSHRIELLNGLWADCAKAPSGALPVKIAEYETVVEVLGKVLFAQKLVSNLKADFPMLGGLKINDLSHLKALHSSLTNLIRSHRLMEIDAQLAKIERELSGLKTSVTSRLLVAIKERNASAYESAYAEVKKTIETKQGLVLIDAQKSKLAQFAPKLVSKLTSRDEATIRLAEKRGLKDAWNWSRALSWLATMNDPNAQQKISLQIESASKQEREILRDLGAAKAWEHCFSRMKEEERQHLKAWSKAVKKIGKGTGKHANKHRREARESMEKCREAIPAWIMPLYRVAESVRPGSETFDVAIIDEASQSGPEALFLNYLAKKIVVVGDDKQISPESWIERENVQLLQEKWISDIPHASHIGVDDSFFDLSEIRFSGRIRLREHFRCMPEIIQFSNNLCYQSEPLIPLKQFGTSRLEPVVAAIHVPSGYQQGTSPKMWNPPEAEEIVARIQKMISDPAYEGKTIGVISLVGDLQAKQIEKMLLEQIGPEEMEKRELVCGDAYAFQGDERDIIILSLVSAPGEGRAIGVLSKAKDERRFNVAASRAKEQMILFHSVSLSDLNPKCLRYKILEYCLNPKIQQNSIEGVEVGKIQELARLSGRSIGTAPQPFDSWFEVDVFLAIHARGYRVIPQYPIAGKRIDMVVEGMKGRVAVECDGEFWHGADRYEQDQSRQRDLERCGFYFWRISESSFFLDREKAMEGLWKTLESRGIYPSSTGGAEVIGTHKAFSEEAESNLNTSPDLSLDAKAEAHTTIEIKDSEESAEQRLVTFAQAIPSQTWLALAHLEHLTPFQKKLAYSLESLASAKMKPTVKQSFWGLDTLLAASKIDYFSELYLKSVEIGKIGDVLKELSSSFKKG